MCRYSRMEYERKLWKYVTRRKKRLMGPILRHIIIKLKMEDYAEGRNLEEDLWRKPRQSYL